MQKVFPASLRIQKIPEAEDWRFEYKKLSENKYFYSRILKGY